MLRSWLALGLDVVVAAATLAAGYRLTTRPATYREAVTEVLAQRQITYGELEIHEVCRPDPNCIIDLRTFTTVVVYRDSASYGQLTCYDRGGDCYVDLATLGIVREPLRDLRGVRVLPKPLVRAGEPILAHMRAMTRRVRP